eukprot:7382792-Prymnesium_polylepis.1
MSCRCLGQLKPFMQSVRGHQAAQPGELSIRHTQTFDFHTGRGAKLCRIGSVPDAAPLPSSSTACVSSTPLAASPVSFGLRGVAVASAARSSGSLCSLPSELLQLLFIAAVRGGGALFSLGGCREKLEKSLKPF